MKKKINWLRLLFAYLLAGFVSGTITMMMYGTNYNVLAFLNDISLGLIRSILNLTWVPMFFGIVTGLLYYYYGYPRK